MAGGIGPTGFTKKTLEEILSEIETDERATIDPALNQQPTAPVGQLNGVFSRKAAELWELAETVYNAFNSGAAEGAQADNVAALTGTVRKSARKSRTAQTLNLNAGVTVPAGSVVSVAGQPQYKFELQADVVSTTSGNYPGIMLSQQTGAIPANAGTLTVIETPVSGWNSTTNALDAELGAPVETDAALMLRRQDELSAAGDSTLPGIKADVLKVAGVRDCLVFENTSLETDVNGLPGKSFEVVIWDGDPNDADDAEVAQTIWDSKPAGMEMHGSITTAIVDSDDVSRDVKWSRATERSLYLDYFLTTNSHYPTDGDAQLKALVVAYCQANFGLSDDVIALELRSIVLEKNGGIAGVVDVPTFELGFSVAPSGSSNLAVGIREIAIADSARITIA